MLLPGKSHGRRSLEGCSPWGRWGLDTTEQLHFHVSLSCIGKGNGNPLQCSCLENPRDGRAWWAAVYGVAQSRTWLKWLSSSSSRLQNISFDQAEPLLQEQSVKEKPTSRQKEEQQLSFQSPGLYPLSQNLNLKFKLKNPQRVLKEHPLFFRSWNSGPRSLKKNHPSPYR